MVTTTEVYKDEKIDCDICEGHKVLQREQGLGIDNLTVCTHCNGVGKLKRVIYKDTINPEKNIFAKFFFGFMRLFHKNFKVKYNMKVYSLPNKKKGMKI